MDQEKKSGLFQDFPAISTKEWEEKIHADLKGADYEKRLVWKTPEGLAVQPYYRSEHLENLPHMGILPGEAPYVRGHKIKNNDWEIRQDFEEPDLAKANELATNAISKGAESVGINASEVESKDNLKSLLNGIDPEKTPIHFIHGKNYPELFGQLCELHPSANVRGSLNFDPLGYYLLYGKFYETADSNMEDAKKLIHSAKKDKPGFRVVTINGQHYHNAGASIVQELAFSLAQASEYLAGLTKKGLSADDIAPFIQFTLATGSNYFMEIAKFRAVKLLWASILEAYGISDPGLSKINLHAVTSNWNKSVYDPYVNMLRTSTEAMAAAIGGVESMTVNPFDTSFKKPDKFSLRIARNQQIVLKHEAYFNKVADPAAGSYYVENLTHSIAEAAWKLFVEAEEMGGFIKAVEKGFIGQQIEATCQRRDIDIAMRKQVFVGTNLYPNTSERMLDKVTPTAKLTDLSGLRQYRGPQAFEAIRMAVENHEAKGFTTPKVFMFTFGNPAMRKARATFASNFFGVAGYEIIDNLGFTDLNKGVESALASGAQIVVLCSSDEEYADMVSAATSIKEQSPSTQVVVAGNPKELIEKLREAGVDDFIHIRTNVLDSLTRYNEKLEIA